MVVEQVRFLLGLAALHVLALGTSDSYIDARALASFQLFCSGNVNGELQCRSR